MGTLFFHQVFSSKNLFLINPNRNMLFWMFAPSFELERAKSLIVRPLSPPWKIKDFQGLPLIWPRNFNVFNPWVDHELPRKCCPCPCLEIQGFSRLSIDKPWSPISSFSLTSTLIIKFLLFSRSLKTLDYWKNWNKIQPFIFSLWIYPRI